MPIEDFCYVVIFVLYGAAMYLWGRRSGLQKAADDMEEIWEGRKRNDNSSGQ